MATLIPATIDVETYYDSEYSLSKMTPEEYIRDERFQLLGCAVQPHNRRSKYITGNTEEEIIAKLRRYDWSQIYAFGHNMSGFDGLVLTERVGVRPRFYGCTLAMAGQVMGGAPTQSKSNRPSLSLDAVAQYLGLEGKIQGTLASVKGKRLEDLTYVDRQRMEHYANRDAEQCTAIVKLLQPYVPPEDMRIIHWFTKMFAEPRLHLDGASYQTWLTQMVEAKERLLDSLGVTDKDIRSDKKFAALLENLGIEPPTKVNAKGVTKYAFAKTDKEFTDLQACGDETVESLVGCRLKVKTTIEQSRTERFVGIASRGPLPVMLNWGRTHTLRAGGAGKINLQNLSKGKPPKAATPPSTLLVTPKGLRTVNAVDEDNDTVSTREGDEFPIGDTHLFNLRDGIKAPPGKKIVVVDSSNIELRVAHTLCGQTDTIAKLRNGEDLYCSFATDLYGRVITKADKRERQHGKVGMLQLQYQSGAVSFKNAARIMGGIILTADESEATVEMYRGRFRKLPEMWRRCARAITAMYNGEVMQLDDYGLIRTDKERLVLPRGRFLHYANLRQESDPDWGTQWFYDCRITGKKKKLYGGALFENICQALAGVIVMDQCMELEKEFGRYDRPGDGVVLTVHDEGVMIVPECDAQYALAKGVKVMSTPPSWWPDLPLAAEGDIADRYGSAK